ncbi:MAG: hypothetical protein HYU97_07675 [Deltaproteobacteria bacterium]|nr:hypothetical protein [Deltaproteobacteria bacterium]
MVSPPSLDGYCAAIEPDTSKQVSGVETPLPPSPEEIQAQTLTMIETIYTLDPSDANLQLLLVTYAKIGVNLPDLKKRLQAAEATLSTSLLDQPRPPNPGVVSDYLLTASLKQIDAEQKHHATSTLEKARPVYEAWSKRVYDLIETAHPDVGGPEGLENNYIKLVQWGLAAQWMQDRPKAHHYFAQAQECFDTAKIPHKPEYVAKELQVLYALLKDSESFPEQEVLLYDAKKLLNELAQCPFLEDWVALRTQYEELEADFHIRRVEYYLQQEWINLEDYFFSIMVILKSLCRSYEELMGFTLDPLMKNRLAQSYVEKRLALYEHSLDEILSRYSQDPHKAYDEAVVAAQFLHIDVAHYAKEVGDEKVQEAWAREEFAAAHYEFRIGKVKVAIEHLKDLQKNYPQSMRVFVRNGLCGQHTRVSSCE